jgi:hypothetical protein
VTGRRASTSGRCVSRRPKAALSIRRGTSPAGCPRRRPGFAGRHRTTARNPGGLSRVWGCWAEEGMTSCMFHRLGIKDEVGFAPGGDRGRQPAVQLRCSGDPPPG